MIARLLAAASLTLAASVAGAQDMAGDPAKGEKVFRKCQACHAVGADAKDKQGPVLNGIIGRAAGSHEGFKYSDAMQEAAAGGLEWTEENLAAFLTKPKDFMKGTKMTFAGLRKEQDVADVLAYLATFAEDGAAAEEGEGS
ncbi:MAG: cytochrome c family protein [Vannielia sp.]|uniref:c-type cytochrome n=1 Tax=Rhodobacterales TaxID=204455 RepID=UPI0020955DC2|nr:cytochrome c family protein [Oceanicola sp. 502str15]MCO6382097.1 c-type cytochrome [Oceanicola sp. 502str15]